MEHTSIVPARGLLTPADRAAISNTIERLIALLDRTDVQFDPDEPLFVSFGDGLPGEADDSEEDDHGEDDDPAGQCDEDGINTKVLRVGGTVWGGPGCPISDPGRGIDDDGHDDINDDREHDEWVMPVYGVDQTKTPELPPSARLG